MRSGYCEGVEVAEIDLRLIVKIARLTGCKNFVGKRKKCIYSMRSLTLGQWRFENESDM